MATILVVEDEPDLRHIYRAALERSGHTVFEAVDGAMAERMANRIRPDAVLADVVMPRVGGRELLWRLSETHPGIPVILISGLVPADQFQDDLRPAAYLQKPLSPGEIAEAVAAVLG